MSVEIIKEEKEKSLKPTNLKIKKLENLVSYSAYLLIPPKNNCVFFFFKWEVTLDLKSKLTRNQLINQRTLHKACKHPYFLSIAGESRGLR